MVLSDSGILSCPDLTGVPVRCVADRGGTKYIASSFTPDGAGFVAVGKDGSLTLFLPKSDFDYCAKNYEYDPGNVIPSDAPQKFLSVRYADRIYGESKIAADGMISFNSDGTVFLDSDNHLWVIDYRYSDRDQAGFVQPSTQKRMLSDEYVKKTNKIAKQNFQESTKRKKGFFSKLFGKK